MSRGLGDVYKRQIVFSTSSCNNISLTTSNTNVGCYGGSDGTVDLTVSGGSGSYSYLWSDGSTTEDLTSLSAGTYSVTVTDNSWGCTETTSVTVTEPSTTFDVSIQASSGGSVCSGSSIQLSMTGFAAASNTYQWSDDNGVISGATSSTYITTSSGDYNLTVTTSAGCVATSSDLAVNIITVDVPSALSTSNIQLDRATMNWSAVSDADHYDIRMRVQGSSTWTVLLDNLYGTSKQKINLASATTYEWKIRSACSNDSSSVSAWSSVQSFTTLAPCTAPLNPVTSAITLTEATLEWDVVSGASAYIVRYKKTTDAFSAFIIDTVTTNSYTVTSLDQATAYHWRVKTMCDANGTNNSPNTSYIVFSTSSCNCLLYTSPSPRDKRQSRMPSSA